MSDGIKPMVKIPLLGRLTLLQALGLLAFLGIGLTALLHLV